MPSNDASFFSAQQQAIERMKEMSSRSQLNGQQHPTPAMPDFVQLKEQPPSDPPPKEPEKQSKNDSSPPPKKEGLSGLLEGLGLPFLNSAKNDRDFLLILGLGYLLWHDSSDRLLLLALLYILL